MSRNQLESRVAEFRAFNRFWTARIGALDARLLETPYSLTEARVIYELALRKVVEVRELRKELDLDAGYLSRILQRFRTERIVSIAPSRTDARRQIIALTAKGRRAFTLLDKRSCAEVRNLLAKQPDDAQGRIVGAMTTIRRALDPERTAATAYVLRAPQAGELGWVVHRHGALYAHQYGWNEEFEALVARVVADYVANRDPEREAAWIAEVEGEPAGCIFCVKKTARVAQLRLLLVEPKARGLGIGARLVDECIRFARDRGYKELVLWTNDILHGARRLYQRAGFRLVRQARHNAFGQQLREQIWSLRLA